VDGTSSRLQLIHHGYSRWTTVFTSYHGILWLRGWLRATPGTHKYDGTPSCGSPFPLRRIIQSPADERKRVVWPLFHLRVTSNKPRAIDPRSHHLSSFKLSRPGTSGRVLTQLTIDYSLPREMSMELCKINSICSRTESMPWVKEQPST